MALWDGWRAPVRAVALLVLRRAVVLGAPGVPLLKRLLSHAWLFIVVMRGSLIKAVYRHLKGEGADTITQPLRLQLKESSELYRGQCPWKRSESEIAAINCLLITTIECKWWNVNHVAVGQLGMRVYDKHATCALQGRPPHRGSMPHLAAEVQRQQRAEEAGAGVHVAGGVPVVVAKVHGGVVEKLWLHKVVHDAVHGVAEEHQRAGAPLGGVALVLGGKLRVGRKGTIRAA